MPPPEMRQAGPCPSPVVAHGSQPPRSRRDPVIPHPPPRPLPRLAHWCWHRKATFQSPPPPNSLPTLDSWQSRGEGCGWGGLWDGPESEHLSPGCGRKQARDRAVPSPSPRVGVLWPTPPTRPHCRAESGVSDAVFGVREKTHPLQVAKFLL